MDNHYIQVILAYLRVHPHIGGLFTFLVAFTESLPLIGTIMPGTVTMTIVGILIGTGTLPMIPSLLIASGGAFMGDCIGFAMGYYFDGALRTLWPFSKYPQWLAMGEAFFKKHGGKSIVLGRFIGPARSTVPLVAGLLRFTWLRFSLAALPSAVLWAFMYLVPGILLGALSREVPPGETTRFFLYGLGLLAIMWLTFWLIQHFFTQLARGINFVTDQLWRTLSRKNPGHFLIHCIANQQEKEDHHQLTLSLFAILSGILFLILLFSVRSHGVLTYWNDPIFHVLQSIHTTCWDAAFVVISLMGAPKTIACIVPLFAVGLALKNQWRTGIHFFAAFVLAVGSGFVFKKLSHSLRPQGLHYIPPSFSFPSGHTLISFVIFGFIAFLTAQVISKKARWIPYSMAGTLITLVALSRIYLGAHWLTDVIGSALLGFTILFACIISYHRMPNIAHRLQLSPQTLALFLTLSVGIAWSANIALFFHRDLRGIAPIWPQKQTTIDAWWKNPLSVTPLFRNNRFGQPFQPFNVQWQGSPADITRTLIAQGWKIVPSHRSLKSSLKRFSDLDAQYHLPILPWLYQNKPPILFFTKEMPARKQIIELRLWDSNVTFPASHATLWIGTINLRIPPKKLGSLKDHSTISFLDSNGISTVYADTSTYQRKSIVIPKEMASEATSHLAWGHAILLIRA